MFQVGFILMNFTAILLPQDRCSMPAEHFMAEHFFGKRGLFLGSFLGSFFSSLVIYTYPNIIYLTFW